MKLYAETLEMDKTGVVPPASRSILIRQKNRREWYTSTFQTSPELARKRFFVEVTIIVEIADKLVQKNRLNSD